MKRIVVLLFCALFLSGCHPRVWLDPAKFEPKFDPQVVSVYKGKEIYLEVYQRAYNADFAFYYSTRGITRYTCHPSINYYLDAVFRSSVISLGFILYEAQPRTSVVPELRISVNSLSDEQFGLEAQILMDNAIRFSKAYKIDMPRPDFDTSTPDLEKRSYLMMTMLQTALFGDPAFQKALSEVHSIKINQ